MSNRDFGTVQSHDVIKAALNLHSFQSRQGHFAGLISFSITTAISGTITAVAMPVDLVLSQVMRHSHEVQRPTKDNVMDECDPSEWEDGKIMT